MSAPVWESKLDEIWQCKVTRLPGEKYLGLLTVEAEGRPEKLSVEVDLSYGAIYGPDVSDLAEWQSKVIAFVDGLES